VTSWAPVRRLDVDEVLGQLAEATGLRLTADGRCPGGQVGACYVRWPDGHRSVLTWRPGEGQDDTTALVEAARSAGIPAPRYELVADLGGAQAIVQELAPGVPPATTDQRLVAEMVELSGRCAGLLADRPELPPPALYLRHSGPGFCLHEPLAGSGRRTARLLDWVRSVGVERDIADGPDLVHTDFHPGNVLVDDGRISGVVDWDGIGRGDRALDLVVLRFDLHLRAPDLGGWMDEVLSQSVPADRLRAYWAHTGLRLVDWAIRHFGPSDVDHWLDLAERGERI
jgi:hypothetical protein